MSGLLRRPWLLTAVLAVLLTLGVGFLVARHNAAEKAKTAAATAHAVVSPYAAIANGKADVEGGVISVAARRAGVVRDVLVQEGDKVIKGQVLARQEDEEAVLGMQRSAAEVTQARAQITALQVKLDAAKREYARLERLSESNFVARQRLDQQNDEIRDWTAQIVAQRASVETAEARRREAAYVVELSVIRAPADGVIVRRYANPGAGASTLNVSTMFDLEPANARIVRAEIVESAIPAVSIGQPVEIIPEADGSKMYRGKVLRRAAMFGSRKLQSDDPAERSDERVVEVVVSADGAPLLIGQRVLVKFLKVAGQR
jgi:HlyD family secretion protein